MQDRPPTTHMIDALVEGKLITEIDIVPKGVKMVHSWASDQRTVFAVVTILYELKK